MKLIIYIYKNMYLHKQALTELNLQVALFRDLLLGVGSARDCPELREKIRKIRMEAVEDVVKTNNSLLPHVKKYCNQIKQKINF